MQAAAGAAAGARCRWLGAGSPTAGGWRVGGDARYPVLGAGGPGPEV